MKILAIESSCDETSVAILEDTKVLCNIIATQEAHKKYGGVIPELASRIHIKNIIPVLDIALKKSNVKLNEIDAFAFAQYPGLLGSLIVGCSFIKSFSLVYNKPIIGVNHIQAHITSIFLNNHKPKFPFLCLTVSGGHTQIVLCTDYLEYKIIGATIDDAAGEAFDKSASILGLEYPGGIMIDKLSKNGDFLKFKFAKPKVANFDYSFSGLKTSILYFVQKQKLIDEKFIEKNLNDLCASIQYSIITILLDKFFEAAKYFNIKNLSISGGVSANSFLRKTFIDKCKHLGLEYYMPEFEYCTDNAAMIAINAYYKYLKKDFLELNAVPFANVNNK